MVPSATIARWCIVPPLGQCCSSFGSDRYVRLEGQHVRDWAELAIIAITAGDRWGLGLAVDLQPNRIAPDWAELAIIAGERWGLGLAGDLQRNRITLDRDWAELAAIIAAEHWGLGLAVDLQLNRIAPGCKRWTSLATQRCCCHRGAPSLQAWWTGLVRLHFGTGCDSRADHCVVVVREVRLQPHFGREIRRVAPEPPH